MRTAGIATSFAVLLLSACGAAPDDTSGPSSAEASPASYEDRSPEEIARDVADAMDGISSLRMSGWVIEEGTTIDMDLTVAKNGNCEGVMTFRGEGRFELIVAEGGEQVYYKPDEKFWHTHGGPAADRIIAMVGDKWVVPPDDNKTPLAAACDWEKLTGEFDEPEEYGFEKVTGTSQVDGEATVTIACKEDGDDGVAHVRAHAPHYLVKTGLTGKGDFTLSDFGVPVEPVPPTDVVDLSGGVAA
jgi:hypothetical protein